MRFILEKSLKILALSLLHVYRLILSPVMHWLAGPGMGCRFYPSCSNYAFKAVQEYGGQLKTFRLIGQRLVRCQPWGGSGYDPVPVSDEKKIKS
jgi:uncharacterized protein